MIAPCSKCGGDRVEIKKGNGIRYRCRPCENEYQRANYSANAERIRIKRAISMAEARRDPARREQYLGYQTKAWRNGGREKRKAWMESLRDREPFRWKALTIHTSIRGKLKASDLKAIWDRNPGVCALTGRPLAMLDAELDHIIPRSRGGSNDIDNLRWVCSQANAAKGDMLDTEFLGLCTQISEWIGRRILSGVNE